MTNVRITPKKVKLAGGEKRMEKAFEFAEAHGIVVERTGGQHFKFTCPNGSVTFSSATPRNHYGADRAISQMKRALRGEN